MSTYNEPLNPEATLKAANHMYLFNASEAKQLQNIVPPANALQAKPVVTLVSNKKQ